jgi:hypothetical protein
VGPGCQIVSHPRTTLRMPRNTPARIELRFLRHDRPCWPQQIFPNPHSLAIKQCPATPSSIRLTRKPRPNMHGRGFRSPAIGAQAPFHRCSLAPLPPRSGRHPPPRAPTAAQKAPTNMGAPKTACRLGSQGISCRCGTPPQIHSLSWTGFLMRRLTVSISAAGSTCPMLRVM